MVIIVRHNAVIYLISTTYDYDELANPIDKEVEKRVFANEMSVSAREFYNAGVSDLKPEKQFEIYSFEYKGETKLRHGQTKYKVIRTMSKGDKMQIICEKGDN